MNNKTTMLQYCKQVLIAVYFDKRLFLREYRKSLRWLTQTEVVELKQWIRMSPQPILK